MTQTMPHEAPPAVTTALPAAHNLAFHAARDSDIEQARSYLLAELQGIPVPDARPGGRLAPAPDGGCSRPLPWPH